MHKIYFNRTDYVFHSPKNICIMISFIQVFNQKFVLSNELLFYNMKTIIKKKNQAITKK